MRFGMQVILAIGRDRCDKKLKPLRCVYGNIDDAKVNFRCTIVLCVKESMFGLLILAVIREIQSNIRTEMEQIHQIIYLWTFAYPESDV
jgi:hypothetical protein